MVSPTPCIALQAAAVAQAVGFTAQEATALRNISTLLPAISSTGVPRACDATQGTWQQHKLACWDAAARLMKSSSSSIPQVLLWTMRHVTHARVQAPPLLSPTPSPLRISVVAVAGLEQQALKSSIDPLYHNVKIYMQVAGRQWGSACRCSGKQAHVVAGVPRQQRGCCCRCVVVAPAASPLTACLTGYGADSSPLRLHPAAAARWVARRTMSGSPGRLLGRWDLRSPWCVLPASGSPTAAGGRTSRWAVARWQLWAGRNESAA